VPSPELKQRLVYYSSLWDECSVYLHSNESESDIRDIRWTLLYYLDENPSVKYVVRDWSDAYSEYIYALPTNDELPFLLREVKEYIYALPTNDELPFLLREVKEIPITFSTDESTNTTFGKATIYEIVQYAIAIDVDFSSEPEGISFDFSEDYREYNEDGLIILKSVPRMGVYLRLETAIDSSINSFFTLHFRINLTDVQLAVVFYYDQDGDGRFSGYNSSDYVKSATFSQVQEGWIKDEWYEIFQSVPPANVLIVQIGLIMNGAENGPITLKSTLIKTEVASGT
jgi:hypothetical protein